jgi:hypothetical protein
MRDEERPDLADRQPVRRDTVDRAPADIKHQVLARDLKHMARRAAIAIEARASGPEGVKLH